MTRIQFSESYAFTTPQSIADYYMAYMCRLGHEEVHVMMLDTKQHMISECLLTKGTVNASLIAPREIFIQALKAGAVSIVLHNDGEHHCAGYTMRGIIDSTQSMCHGMGNT